MGFIPLCFSLLLLLLKACSTHTTAHAWTICEEKDGGGICPTGNTCCAAVSNGSVCISGKVNTLGVYCGVGVGHDGGMTGCGENFTCSVVSDDAGHDTPICKNISPDGASNDPARLPRYQLCQLPATAFQQVYGLFMKKKTSNQGSYLAAYYSSMGSLEQRHERVDTVVISIHGSARNPDDYLCCTNSAFPPHQQDPTSSSILLLAPWFPAPADLPISIYNKNNSNDEPLIWRDKRGDSQDWLPHSWRYGADSTHGNVSAYAVLDALLDRIMEQQPIQFPNLKRIIITGHSAGGQYTQRWALLSSHFLLALNSNNNNNNNANGDDDPVSLRVIVANPKSYAYLDSRRFRADSGTWEVPTHIEIASCPLYNEWEWGLDNITSTSSLPTPYKDHAIQLAGGVAGIVHRYPSRPVVYLSGYLDVLPNGDCMDVYQGPNRRSRSRHYYEYLQTVIYHNDNNKKPIHYRLEVPHVHHDHCLLYQSPEGHIALFGNQSQVATLQKGQEQERQQQQGSLRGRPVWRRYYYNEIHNS
jgi:hypothetical protein